MDRLRKDNDQVRAELYASKLRLIAQVDASHVQFIFRFFSIYYYYACMFRSHTKNIYNLGCEFCTLAH